ncbi:hypothetical protein DL98DRAFT_79902 [Cadophora sp. DSE1049]|nr:hypothetical protein DL98DRAFT_79902 [Cadophora sp. DSE1049]
MAGGYHARHADQRIVNSRSLITSNNPVANIQIQNKFASKGSNSHSFCWEWNMSFELSRDQTHQELSTFPNNNISIWTHMLVCSSGRAIRDLF